MTRSFTRSFARSLTRSVRALLLGALFAALAPAPARAHAVVFPRASTPGAYERYVLRVPNEKNAATTRIEIRFPADARVTSFGDVTGWRLEVLTDSAQRIVGAVWTGTLEPHRFIELPFVAVNPKTTTSLSWPVFQTYADGERVEWTGAEGSKRPASATKIAPAADVAAAPGGGSPAWVPWTALGLAIVSLGLSLRPREVKAAA